MTKSYVSMEQKICVVCGCKYDTNALLMDRRLKESMEQHTVTGYGACDEHQKLADDGYVALIGVNPSNLNSIRMEDANRTGELAHVRKEMFSSMFKINLDPEKFPMVFVESEVIGRLKEMMAEQLH